MTSLRTSAWEANFVTVVLAKITTSEFVYTIGKIMNVDIIPLLSNRKK